MLKKLHKAVIWSTVWLRTALARIWRPAPGPKRCSNCLQKEAFEEFLISGRPWPGQSSLWDGFLRRRASTLSFFASYKKRELLTVSARRQVDPRSPQGTLVSCASGAGTVGAGCPPPPRGGGGSGGGGPRLVFLITKHIFYFEMWNSLKTIGVDALDVFGWFVNVFGRVGSFC